MDGFSDAVSITAVSTKKRAFAFLQMLFCCVFFQTSCASRGRFYDKCFSRSLLLQKNMLYWNQNKTVAVVSAYNAQPGTLPVLPRVKKRKQVKL